MFREISSKNCLTTLRRVKPGFTSNFNLNKKVISSWLFLLRYVVTTVQLVWRNLIPDFTTVQLIWRNLIPDFKVAIIINLVILDTRLQKHVSSSFKTETCCSKELVWLLMQHLSPSYLSTKKDFNDIQITFYLIVKWILIPWLLVFD